MFVLGELSDVEVLGHAAVNVVGVENHDFSPGGEGQEKEAQGRKEADQALTDDTVHDFSSSSISLLALHGCEKPLLSLYDGDVHLSICITGESFDLMALRKKSEESPVSLEAKNLPRRRFRAKIQRRISLFGRKKERV